MNRKIWLGLALIVVSYGELLIRKSWALAHHFAAGFPYSFAVAFFVFGVIILGEGITQRFKGVSLLGLARGSKRKLLTFLVVAAFVGVLAEVLGTWLGKLWYYAYYPRWFYWPALIPSFILYWIMLCEAYMAGKALWDHYLKSGGKDKHPLKYFTYEHNLYFLLGTAGIAAIVYAAISLAFHFAQHGYSFDPYQGTGYAPPLRDMLTLFFGIWGFAEAVLYTRDSPSLIRSILHGYFAPLLGLLTASLLLSFVWETQNAQVGYWVYVHWPWPGVKIFGVQAVIFLAWPANLVLFSVLSPAIMSSWAGAFWSRPGRIKRKEAKRGTATAV